MKNESQRYSVPTFFKLVRFSSFRSDASALLAVGFAGSAHFCASLIYLCGIAQWRISWYNSEKGGRKMANVVRTSLEALAQSLAGGRRSAKGTNAFTGQDSIMTPGVPLTPLDGEKQPRQYQYSVGQNIILQPRGENIGKSPLTPFATLRALADTYDLVRVTIESRKEQLSGMEWDIVPVDEELKAADIEKYATEIRMVKDFFEYPDKENSWYDWLGMVMEEILVVDALSIYRHKTKGGKLWALEVVDGSTVKPLIDVRGRKPAPPNPAYQQILYGYTRADFTAEDLLYKPKNKRAWTPYGFSPVEYVIIAVNMGLRRQNHYLSYYTDGNLPDGGIYEMPEGLGIDQTRQFQEMWDTLLSGNSAERQRLRFVPGGGKYIPTKAYDFQYEFDEWLATIICAAFGVNPMIFKKQMNRATAMVQDGVQTDLGLRPMQTFITGILNQIIKQDLGMPHLKFKWIKKKKEDEKMDIEKNEKYVKSAIYSIDDVLDKEGREKQGIPRFVMVQDGPIFLTPEYIKMRIDQQMQGLEAPKMDEEAPKVQTQPEGEKPAEKVPKKDVQEELKRFEKYAVKKKSRPFQTELIPDRVYDGVMVKLETTDTPEGIKAVFKAAKDELEDENLNKAYKAFKKKLTAILAAAGSGFAHFTNKYDNGKILVEQVGTYTFLKEEKILIDGVSSFHEIGFEAGSEEINFFQEYPRMKGKEWAGKYAGELITQLEESTKQMVRSTIEASIEAGETYLELQAQLMEQYGFSPKRAAIIARTESAKCYNIGAVDAWNNSGIVDKVRVSDGDYDEKCQAADGQIWTLEYAKSHPIEHPNCVREFFPILKE